MTGPVQKEAMVGEAMIGAGFALLAVVLTATTDLLAKILAQGFPLAQVNFFAALVGIIGAWALSLSGLNLAGFAGGGLRTAYPRTMALRSLSAVGASVCYFLAYKNLQLTEVFVFTALLPVFAGMMSGPLLGERVAPRHWAALGASFLGVALVMPAPGGDGAGWLWYGVAFMASLLGAFSMTLGRRIGRHEKNAAALVFYPQVAMAAIMWVALPKELVPMGPAEIALTVVFGIGFLVSKVAIAAALSRAPSLVVTPMLNLQFFALLALGYLAFGELPGQGIYAGAAIVVAAGLYLTFSAAQPGSRLRPLRARRLAQA